MRKRWNLWALVILLLFLNGCKQLETIEETFAEKEEITVTPQLPQFVIEQETEELEEEILLPRSYSYIEEGRMPVLKNQGNTNSCWAFASLSALESSKDEDSRGPYSTDHLIYQNTFHNTFEAGGAYVVTTSYLLSWSGPVEEGQDPTDGESPKNLEEVVHVQEIRESQPRDFETIKRFVYLYGGVESALYVDFQEDLTESSYYNEESNCFCYLGEEMANHDVVIVGWDDDYPAENFVGEVTQDGAFLCQNSWGDAFGDGGTFYVSYEDVNIGGYGIVYSRIDDADNYDKIYQSDLCGFTAQIGYQQESSWFANVYKAEEALNLRAAGFYTTGPDTEYEIYIVSNFLNEDSFLFKRKVCEGKLEDAGFYTIDFPEDILIEAGNDFGIVVNIMTPDAEYPVAIECRVPDLSEQADVTDGRGYLSLQGNRWEHVEETKEYNICLKVYADLR